MSGENGHRDEVGGGAHGAEPVEEAEHEGEEGLVGVADVNFANLF